MADNSGAPASGAQPLSPSPSAGCVSVAETSRPSVDIGSLLSGSMASTLGSHDVMGGYSGSWASRDEGGGGSMPGSLEASWEYRWAANGGDGRQ